MDDQFKSREYIDRVLLQQASHVLACFCISIPEIREALTDNSTWICDHWSRFLVCFASVYDFSGWENIIMSLVLMLQDELPFCVVGWVSNSVNMPYLLTTSLGLTSLGTMTSSPSLLFESK